MEQTQATENLSDWFNLGEQKPWEPGVYEVESILGGNVYSYWDGEKFKQINITKDFAYKGRNHPTYRQQENISWRGLASDPSAKPKPKARGNRKVTRYVVMAQHKITMAASCDGSFESKKNAESRMEQTLKICGETHRMWIQKIRFRTPEVD